MQESAKAVHRTSNNVQGHIRPVPGRGLSGPLVNAIWEDRARDRSGEEISMGGGGNHGIAGPRSATSLDLEKNCLIVGSMF